MSNIVIKIKAMNHESEITIANDKTINDVKEEIERKDGIPAAMQKLVFGGRALDNATPIKDSGITSGVTVHMVLQLRAARA